MLIGAFDEYRLIGQLGRMTKNEPEHTYCFNTFFPIATVLLIGSLYFIF